jgi:hydroxymethylbilane synthase
MSADATLNAPLRIGTRGSPLALWQANHVAGLLRPLATPRAVELVTIETVGDQVRDRPLGELGGIGVFTKEIQRALLDQRVDVAVHSLKDLPTEPVADLALAAVPTRGPSEDVLIAPQHRLLDRLPRGAVVATGSLRRRSQLLHRRPDLQVKDIRGNVETRLRKSVELGMDGLILARAGLVRLGLADAITEVLDQSWLLPAAGQGALGIECRAADSVTLTLLARLDDPATRAAVTAERALLAALGGGCHVPIGALGRVQGGVLTLRAAVLAPDGSQRIDGERTGSPEEAAALGRALADELLGRGAARLLA